MFVFSVQCLNASSLLSSHGLSQEVDIVLEDFSYLCPALLNQIDVGACVLHGEAPRHQERGRNISKHLSQVDLSGTSIRMELILNQEHVLQ